MKNSKGFTLVELVVVIAILGILAGIAIPRFLEATASARGAKIVADMRTIESAVYVYYAQHNKYPNSSADLTDMIQGGWPVPPAGKAKIASVAKSNVVSEIDNSNEDKAYEFNDVEGVDASSKANPDTGWVKINGHFLADYLYATTAQ